MFEGISLRSGAISGRLRESGSSSKGWSGSNFHTPPASHTPTSTTQKERESSSSQKGASTSTTTELVLHPDDLLAIVRRHLARSQVRVGALKVRIRIPLALLRDEDGKGRIGIDHFGDGDAAEWGMEICDR